MGVDRLVLRDGVPDVAALLAHVPFSFVRCQRVHFCCAACVLLGLLWATLYDMAVLMAFVGGALL